MVMVGCMPEEIESLQAMVAVVVFIALFCANCCVALASIDGLLPDGGFEQGLNQSQWKTSGSVQYIKSGQKQGDLILVVPEGSFAVKLGNGASITQRVNVVKGTEYSITFSVARTCAKSQVLSVSATPSSDASVLNVQTIYDSAGWDAYSWAFKAATDAVDITFQNPNAGEDPSCGPILDSVAIKALSFTQGNKSNLLTNGNFEEGPYMYPDKSIGVLIPSNTTTDHSPLPGWVSKSSKAIKYIDNNHFSVPEGKRAIELIAGYESILGQVVKTTPGKDYVLTFSVGDSRDSCVGSMAVAAFAGPKTLKVPFVSQGKGSSKLAQIKFTATSTESEVVFYSLGYTMTSEGSLCGPVIDDVKLIESP